MSTDDHRPVDDLEGLLASLPAQRRTSGSEGDPGTAPPPFVLPAPFDARDARPQQGASASRITNIDVLANHIENLNQETRKRDVLDGTELSRAELVRSTVFFRPSVWERAWSDGADALRPGGSHGVLLIVARRGYGATTFARQLCARHASADSVLLDLEADWNHPSVGRLPLAPDHTYLLELKDLESDRFDRDFLDRLSTFAASLRGADSRLVVTATDELWAGHHGWVGPGVKVVHLSQPPNAQQLVEHHLEARGLGALIKYVRTANARASIQGRDAVEAVRCVETVVRQWATHRQREAAADHDGAAGPVDRPVRLEHLAPPATPATPADGLQAQIELALADWRNHFDLLFNDPTRPPAAKESPLSLPDRCLLLALAIHGAAPASVIGADAHALETAIEAASGGPQAVGSPTIGTIFGGRGLRPRLLALSADVDPQDRVTFGRPGYSEAVLGYVWDNFPSFRTVLLKWLVSLPVRPRINSDPSPRALTALVLRHRKSQDLDALRDLALQADRAPLLVTVTEGTLKDDHMSGTTWKALSRWAKQATPVRAVVAEVCRGVLLDGGSTQSARRLAMTRLRNLVQTDDRTLRSAVLAVLDLLVARPDMRPMLVREVENWLARDRPASAGRLCLLALMHGEDAGTPWLLRASSPLPESLLRSGLRELFGDVTESPEVIDRAAAWLHKSAADHATADLVLDCLAPTLRGRSQAEAAMSLYQAVRDTTLPNGSRVGDHLFDRITRPETPQGAPDPRRRGPHDCRTGRRDP
ncbi:hypothetical protein [Streptomyces sp. NRRL WC-3742]|uniref:hypothetical protein n=1 Tax=Streptomyces sp. NRRL WC-3742 TaxID=1463934 RepID=UPI0004C72CDB|nr:hypothetical protein [Streptomyces sp. NRRL WC-3742]